MPQCPGAPVRLGIKPDQEESVAGWFLARTGVDVADVRLLEPPVQLEHIVVGRLGQALRLHGGGVELASADHLVSCCVRCVGTCVT